MSVNTSLPAITNYKNWIIDHDAAQRATTDALMIGDHQIAISILEHALRSAEHPFITTNEKGWE